MKSFVKRAEDYILDIIKSLGYDVDKVILNVSSRPEFGDYQYNGVMELAKKYKKPPIEIANEIVSKLQDNENLTNINIQGPGFINISFTNESLIEYMNEIITNLDINIDKVKSKKILIDYGGANVAKALHVGHLRSANIGEAIKRLAQTLGHDIIGDAHLGDSGRPLGFVILEMKKRYPDLVYFKEDYKGEEEDLPITNKDLEELYPTASKKAKEDETYLEEGREIALKILDEKSGYHHLWKKIIELSKNHIKQIYDLLNTNFELWEGESDAYPYIDDIVELLRKEGLVYESEGALVIDVKEETDTVDVPPFILIKSNGGILYQTTEIATIYSRMKRFDLDEIWYLTDERQALHFLQTFRVAEKADILDDTKLYHYGFGTVNGPDGKPFKTRDGGVMPLLTLIDLVRQETYKKIKDNITDENEKKYIALLTAIATIKYADLLPYRMTDYTFDINKFSDVEGKTGPYLLYSTVRMKSLIRKAIEQNMNMSKISIIDNELEKSIILNIINMSQVLNNSLNNRSLNEVCEYIYKLTNSFNTFYANIHILTEQDETKRETYLALSKLVLDINLKILDILAIKVPDRI